FSDPNPTVVPELKRAIDFQIDLLAYYFKHQRLDDAEAFCRELLERNYRNGSEHPYKILARLGQAMVLAFHDKTEALDQLGKLIQPPRGAIPYRIGGVNIGLFEHPELRRLLADALNRLAVDLKVEHFDTKYADGKYAHLEPLRKPGLVRPFRP